MIKFTLEEKKDLWLTLSAIARKSMTTDNIDALTQHEQTIDRDTLNDWIHEEYTIKRGED